MVDSIDKDQKLLRLYRLLLKKYSDAINEQEKRTIGQIKGLIDKDDLTVQSIVADLKPSNYSFEKDYLETAEKAYGFLVKEIDFASADVDISFWLSPKEVIENKIADDEDFAVLLCSMLFALGDEKAYIAIAELDNLSTHAFVITEFKNRFILLDPSQKKPFNNFVGEREKVLENYSFQGAKLKRFLYKFNREQYEQFF
jgi:hypothetical protein